jgi:hypothetical protein
MRKILLLLTLLLLIGVGLIAYEYRKLIVLGWRMATGQELFSFNTPQTNPLENVPTLNPIEKANPFNNSYKNPFE